MNPSIELRLRSMIRAITETILPAVDPGNSLAQEQTRLLLGHLHALLLQHAHAGEIAQLVKRDAERLANDLLREVRGGPQTMGAALHLRAALAGTGSIAHAVEQLLVASGVDGDPVFVDFSERTVLDYSRSQASRGRAWFKAMGFDSAPDTLPDIPALLATWTRGSGA